MSLIGLSPVIQNSGDAESRSVAHSAVRRPSTPNRQLPASKERGWARCANPKNRNHAARMHPAPPIADQIASARASAVAPVVEVRRSMIGSEMCPISM